MAFAACLLIGTVLYLRDGNAPTAASHAFEPARPASDGGDANPGANSATVGAGDIVIQRRDDGHFYVPVEINGTAVEMLVDTGASGIALALDDARRSGVATSIGMREHIGDGASGAVYGDTVDIERVRLGGVELNRVSAVVLSGGETSLLGQDFLRHFKRVEIDGDRLILRGAG